MLIAAPVLALGLLLGACSPTPTSETPAPTERELPMTDPDHTSKPAASEGSTVLEAALGFWSVSIDGASACYMTLNRLAEAGGNGVYLERCSDEALASVAAWRSDGHALELIDGQGVVVARLSQPAVDSWQGQDRQGRQITLAMAPMY